MGSTYRKIKEILVLVIPILIVDSLVISASLCIKVIDHHKSFVPCSLDYLRTVILATLSSALINFGTKYYHHFYNLKGIVEFCSLLLLAYPQKTEIEQTFSNWNLVKRESYLFGAIYNLVNHLTYLYGVILIIWVQEINSHDDTRTQAESSENISELVRQKSTLSNCIQVRRNSYNLKKNVYCGPSNGELSNEHEDLLKSNDNINNNTLVLDYNSDSIEFLNPGTSYNDQNKTPNLTPIHTNYGSVVSITSFNNHNSNGIRPKNPLISILEVITWSLISSFYEIGISLILSIAFIYVPDLDDDLFSWLEIFYYNNIKNFIIEIVIPIGLITSSVHYQLLPKYLDYPQLTLLVFLLISLILLAFGTIYT